MEIAPILAGDRQVIQGYGRGGFKVSDVEWLGAVLVFPDRTMAWPVAGLAALSLTAFEAIRLAEPSIEILLIGTGSRMALLPASLRADLRGLGVGIETMDTGAVCRTYNILLSEERRVAAALLPVD